MTSSVISFSLVMSLSVPTFESGRPRRPFSSGRSLFSLAFTTQMIVTTPSQSFSQASQPAGHVFDASSTGGHCCCCALGTAVRWLPLELATAHCYGNCWRPQQPPPQGGGERAGVLRNSKTKHRTVRCQKPLLPRIELCWLHKCLFVRSERTSTFPQES